jgi:hypothetical protein
MLNDAVGLTAVLIFVPIILWLLMRSGGRPPPD